MSRIILYTYCGFVGTLGILATMASVLTNSRLVKEATEKALDVFPEPKFKE